MSVQADAKAEITNEDVRKRAQLRQLDATKAQALAVVSADTLGSGSLIITGQRLCGLGCWGGADQGGAEHGRQRLHVAAQRPVAASAVCPDTPCSSGRTVVVLQAY